MRRVSGNPFEHGHQLCDAALVPNHPVRAELIESRALPSVVDEVAAEHHLVSIGEARLAKLFGDEPQVELAGQCFLDMLLLIREKADDGDPNLLRLAVDVCAVAVDILSSSF